MAHLRDERLGARAGQRISVSCAYMGKRIPRLSDKRQQANPKPVVLKCISGETDSGKVGRPESDREAVIGALTDDARRAHQDSQDAEEHARIHRQRRDVFVRRLYATGLFSYPQLADRVGVSAETIAKIVQLRSVRSKRK